MAGNNGSGSGKRRSSGAVPQDGAISDVARGLNPGASTGKTEDQKRDEGTDASQAEGAGDHDFSREASAMQRPGGLVIDSYGAGAMSDHPNIAGPTQELVLGQAPQAPCAPMRNSPGFGHGRKFHPDIPNAIMQSPVVRGVEKDPRNDPKHPGHKQADRAHPDYGRPVEQHQGIRTDAPTFVDLKRKAQAEDDADEGTVVEPIEDQQAA